MSNAFPTTFSLGQLARALNGRVVGNRVLCPGPGHSSSDASLSVAPDPGSPDGFLVHSYADDDWRECKDYVRERLGLPGFGSGELRGVVVPRVKLSVSDRQRTERAAVLWGEAVPIAGTPAEAYLVRRGVSYDGEALRWHPNCPFAKDRVGCMVALVRNIVANEPQAIHRTAIDTSGNKLSHLGSNGRLSLGPIGGGAVKLTDDADVTRVIAIGEGIETTLSIRQLPDLDAMPVWSLLTAGGIASFPVLPGIETVWLAADNDASGTGQKAARSAAERLTGAGLETIIISPTEIGADLNDRMARHG